ADEVGDGDVGRGELLAVAQVAREPVDLDGVAVLGHLVTARVANRQVRVVADLAARADWRLLGPEVDPRAVQSRRGRAPLAEQDRVLARHDGMLELRDHALLVANDPREQLLACADLAGQVAAHLLLDGDHLVFALAQLANGLWLDHRSSWSRTRGSSSAREDSLL